MECSLRFPTGSDELIPSVNELRLSNKSQDFLDFHSSSSSVLTYLDGIMFATNPKVFLSEYSPSLKICIKIRKCFGCC